MPITDISHGNPALQFIEKRLQDENYRGSRSSQHNRYTMDQIVKILTLLNEHAPNRSLMAIRTTDTSKRHNNTPEEYDYAKFCEDAKSCTGIGTQDAMRKNLFVDIHRMGLIERFDKNRNAIAPFSHGLVKYVSLAKQGIKLINAGDVLKKYFIFSKGIDQLLRGYINVILDILRDRDNNIYNVEIHEFMFFVSAIDTKTSFNINIEKATDLILAYRKLTSTQKRAVIETLKSSLRPSKFKGTKIDKRDYHNWHNKAAQVFYLLNQTVYFEVRENNYLVLKTGRNNFVSGDSVESDGETRLNRSVSEKYEYFKQHQVRKKVGFELHHVVPLSWSESIHHFKMLDKWQNLVYIDAFSHAKITQSGNRHVVLTLNNDDVILSDFEDDAMRLQNSKNIIYKTQNGSIMKEYNVELMGIID